MLLVGMFHLLFLSLLGYDGSLIYIQLHRGESLEKGRNDLGVYGIGGGGFSNKHTIFLSPGVTQGARPPPFLHHPPFCPHPPRAPPPSNTPPLPRHPPPPFS